MLQAAVTEHYIVICMQPFADKIIVVDVSTADNYTASHHLLSVQDISQNASS